MWLMASVLAISAAFALWKSDLPKHYGRACLDLKHGTVSPGYTWISALRDISMLGYPVLSPHVKRIEHSSKESGCSTGSCACGDPCTCPEMNHPHKAWTEFRPEEFSDAENNLGIAGSFLLLLLMTWFIAWRPSWLVLTPSGMVFPWYMMLGLHSLPIKRWRSVTSVTVAVPKNEVVDEDRFDNTAVVFNFGLANKARVQLGKLSRAMVATFLEDLAKWVSAEQKSPELAKLIRDYLDSQSKLPEDMSFTALWGEDLAMHMAATNFIPLAKGAQLQSNRFIVLAILASGGLSVVYLARTVNGAMVVLKESVIPQHLDDEIKNKAHELFEREATLLTKLNHPKIAKVLDHFRECGRDYLVLEYLPGRNLRQVVKQSGAQSESVVLEWSAQIVDILRYLHESEPPIVHRDLTPDNILLKNDGTIAVIDFGAANEYLGAATGTLVGKQSYISPEQFKGKATPSSDIYALGSTLFFLLTGDDPQALSVSHPKELRECLSQEIDALVAWCTEMEESERATLEQLIKRIEFLRTAAGSSESLAPL